MIHVSEVAEWNAAAVEDLARMAVLSDEPVIYHASVELTVEQIAAIERTKAEVRGRLLIDTIADRLTKMANEDVRNRM